MTVLSRNKNSITQSAAVSSGLKNESWSEFVGVGDGETEVVKKE